LGREIDRRGEEDAVFEVRGKEVFAAGDTSDKAARVFGVAEIDMTQPLTLRSLPYLPQNVG
jgi:hypothetical protein